MSVARKSRIFPPYCTSQSVACLGLVWRIEPPVYARYKSYILLLYYCYRCNSMHGGTCPYSRVIIIYPSGRVNEVDAVVGAPNLFQVRYLTPRH